MEAKVKGKRKIKPMTDTKQIWKSKKDIVPSMLPLMDGDFRAGEVFANVGQPKNEMIRKQSTMKSGGGTMLLGAIKEGLKIDNFDEVPDMGGLIDELVDQFESDEEQQKRRIGKSERIQKRKKFSEDD